MNKEILRLAVPNIISNISVPLLSAIDLILMGHQGEDTPLMIGAIAIGAAIFNMVYWGFGFLRMGTTGLTAQAFGAKNNDEVSRLLGQGGFVALVSALVLLVFQIPIGQFSFWIMGAETGSETYLVAQSYFFIRIWAAPAVLLLNVLNGWFFGMQNARFPMWTVIAINIANLIFNLLFVIVFEMQAEGVAYGTLLAQYFGLLVSLLFFFKNYNSFGQRIKTVFEVSLASFKRFFAVNRDIFIRTVCLIITYTYFTRVSTLSGEIILSVNTVLLQLHLISSYAVDGFGFASESLVGKYVGSKNEVLLRKSVRLSLIWGLVLASIFGFSYLFFGENIVRLFAEHETVIAESTNYLTLLFLAVMVGAPAFIWDGIYIGATASVAMRNNMLAATFLGFFPAYFLLEPYYGNYALWLAMIIYMLFRSVGLGLMAEKKIYKLA